MKPSKVKSQKAKERKIKALEQNEREIDLLLKQRDKLIENRYYTRIDFAAAHLYGYRFKGARPLCAFFPD